MSRTHRPNETTLESAPATGVDEIDAMAPWFHNLHLPDGTQTAPHHALGDFPRNKWELIAPYLPDDLTEWRALDIGCNAGFYTFALAQRGVDVHGIDVDDHYLRQARWAAAQLDLAHRTRFENLGVYDLARARRRYDLVWFMGVFYHLRYPLLALDLVTRCTEQLLVFQALSMPGEERLDVPTNTDFNDRSLMREHGWPKLAFIEHRLAGDPTNWWAPNHAGTEAMLRSCGMEVLARPEEETFLCRPHPQLYDQCQAARRAELEAATGISHPRSL